MLLLRLLWLLLQHYKVLMLLLALLLQQLVRLRLLRQKLLWLQ
jgi:hypothetical protein